MMENVNRFFQNFPGTSTWIIAPKEWRERQLSNEVRHEAQSSKADERLLKMQNHGAGLTMENEDKKNKTSLLRQEKTEQIVKEIL